MGDLLGTAEEANGVGLEHGRNGNDRFQSVSTARATRFQGLVHNSRMQSAGGTVHDPEPSFPDRLRSAMERKGVNANQMQVAMAKAGYHLPRQTIGNMLRGRTRMPRWDKLVLISSFLGVRPEWLADGVPPMIPTPQLDEAEMQLVLAFRAMSMHHRKDLCDIAERWAESDEDDDPGPKTPTYPQRAMKQ